MSDSTPTYRYRGWVARYQDRLEWSPPIADRSTLSALWSIAERSERYGDQRVQVEPA